MTRCIDTLPTNHTVYCPIRAVFHDFGQFHLLIGGKPTLRAAAPFREWVLPAAMEKVRKRLKSVDDGDRQMVTILGCVPADGLAAVEAACQKALDHGVCSVSVIINILARSRDPAPAATLQIPDALRLAHEPVADCARYDRLRRVS